jgi:hypothetical protein
MPRCDYCGMIYDFAVCPYDGTPLSYNWQFDQVCQNPNPNIHHQLAIPMQYQIYVPYSPYRTVAACPNCRTPYFYSYLTPEQRAQFNRQRLATGCFIATAAMESHLHPHVQSLRNFRDSILLKSRHKDSFENLLRFYYRFSPPVARIMSKHKSLKFLLRYTIVYPVVFGIKMVLPIFNIVLGIEKDVKRKKMS